MARVRIESILDHLSSDLRRALEDALSRVGADRVDARQLYREFVRAADRKCNTWESVPDSSVDAE
jgi:hypothetical protein